VLEPFCTPKGVPFHARIAPRHHYRTHWRHAHRCGGVGFPERSRARSWGHLGGPAKETQKEAPEAQKKEKEEEAEKEEETEKEQKA
jgi:hypothetical protein